MEAQRLPGNLRDARKLLLGKLQVGAGLRRQGLMVHEEEQVGDGLKRVIDLVRDGGRKSANRSKFLALNEGAFCELLLRKICEEDGDAGLGRVARRIDAGGANQDRDAPAILAEIGLFVGSGRAARLQLRDGDSIGFGKLRRGEIAPAHGAGRDLVTGVAKQLEQRWIDVGDTALEVADQQADTGGFDESAEALFTLPQLLGGASLRVHVGDRDDAAEQRSTLIEDGCGTQRDPGQGPVAALVEDLLGGHGLPARDRPR